MKRVRPRDSVYEAIEYGKRNPRIVSFVGAGGKTTLLYRLAGELREKKMSVLISTTTKMYHPASHYVEWEGRESVRTVRSRIEKDGLAVVGRRYREGKITGIPQADYELLPALADVLLIEADGSKQKPVKVPAAHEPALFPGTELVVGVLGMAGVGRTVKEAAHRPEAVAAFLQTDGGHRITEEDLDRIADSPLGLRKGVACAYIAVGNEYQMERNYYEQLKESLDQEMVSVTYLDGLAGQDAQDGVQAGEKLLLPAEAFAKETGVHQMDGRLVFAERLRRPPVCVICGAGHVGIPLVKLASFAGFEVMVAEDRPAFADLARKAGADKVVCDSFSAALSSVDGGDQVYFVVMTRGHRYDETCLREILHKPSAYVGMMASRGRAARMRQTLLEAGYEKEDVERIHMPIGLPIHAQTPEEIAVSVLAEMIAVKNEAGTGAGYDRELLTKIVEKDGKEPWILATIIQRTGSAPRGVGTKMLIMEGGRTAGSIGGGCMEAEVIREGLLFLKKREAPVKIVTADMSGAQAEDEGMVCGGRIEVLLEVIE